MYLIDTNIWLERLLNQERAEEVAIFLSSVDTSLMAITDFSFHSIGVILTRFNKLELLHDFIEDVFIDGRLTLLILQPNEIQILCKEQPEFNLDFDDAYQYQVAKVYSCTLISFDKDFDKTDIIRIEPKNVR